MCLCYPPPHTQNRVTRNCFFKTALLVFATFIILFSFVGSADGIQMTVPGSTPVEPVFDWTDIENAVLAASGNVLIEVMNDITAGNEVIIPAGVHVFLRSNPSSPNTYSIFHTMTGPANQRHFIVDGGSLSIGDIHLTGPSIIGVSRGGIGVTSGGQLEMFTGSVISGNSWGAGGAMQISGTFVMHDGKISGNSASNGGGVDLVSGSFTMHDGIISKNVASSHGGGLRMWTLSTFTMKGGTISDNSAMSATGAGGIFAFSATLTMYDGIISNNSALGNGGGVLISDSSLTIIDGVIKENKAQAGGGIAVMSDSILIMHNGKIIDNIADSGGGIFVGSATFTMYNGIICGNEAAVWDGGGIGIDSGLSNSVTINGGRICCNTAMRNGGGIFAWNYTLLTTSTAVIFRNNTASTAHDFSLSPEFGSGFVTPSGPVWDPTPGGSVANIEWGRLSIGGTHALNNYDINYIDFPITTQIVTFNPNDGVFAGVKPQPTRLISSGTPTIDATYASAFDASGNLLNRNLPRPTKSGYIFDGWFDTQANANGITEDGRVQSTDSVTNDASRTLWARWTPAPPAGGGGGSGTGNATILDPPIIRPPPVIPEIPEPPVVPELPEPEIPVTVILLSIIGIAVFAYRKVEEAKEKENP